LFSVGVSKGSEDAKDLAKAADERAEAAMTLVAESMEAVLVARIATSAALEEIGALDRQAEKLTGGEVMSSMEDVKEEAGGEAAVTGATPAVAKDAEEKKDKEKEKKAKDKGKDKKAKDKGEEEKKPEPPKASSAKSSKQFASKFFSSSDQPASLAALGVGLALGVGFFAGMMVPGGRKMISHTAASVSTTINSGYETILSKIPESERKIAEHAMHESHEAGLTDALTLLFTSILAVTLVSKIPGGSPVLGFLLGGAAVGPYTTGLVSHVGQAQVLAEFGVVFLLFNIGLELSYERLVSMSKFIFGMGSAQMVLTTMVGAAIAVGCGLAVPPAVVIGMGLAFSSTAVALQVLQDRGETGARHGRATFSVLLFQDLTVVLVFMLVPLLAGPDAGSITAIGASLAKAIVKTVVAIGVIMAVGRSIIRPIYNRIAKLGKAEVMTATTLFTALGTSLLTQSLGLSMALGAFLAGLLLAETEFHLQVESDIAPFRGLLLGLFFMTVGMQIDPACLFQNFGVICACALGLLAYKMGVMAVCGKLFGLSLLTSLRSGVYVAPGGEFAFVTFGLAAGAGLLTMETVNIINLAVVLTMAATPLLANVGAQLKSLMKQDKSVASLQAKEGEVDDLSGHVIIAGYGEPHIPKP
jgi:monovalent cation:proton antiporter-2 (CPA2) family protein